MKRVWSVLSMLSAAIALTSCLQFAKADGGFSDSYPGSGEYLTISYADAQIALAASCYYRVYGKFPANWSEIVSKGISSSTLVGYNMEPIDPDNSSLDFPGDVYYENNNGTAFVHTMDLDHQSKRIRLQMPSQYKNRLGSISNVIELPAEKEARLNQIINDEDQLLQFAIAANISRSLMIYMDVHGSYPQNMTEFMESGLSPVTADSINPVTGKPFKFDGSPGDLRIEFLDDAVSVTHVDELGIELPRINYY